MYASNAQALPLELFGVIIGHLADSERNTAPETSSFHCELKSTKSCSLVCRAFRTLSQKHIFDSIQTFNVEELKTDPVEDFDCTYLDWLPIFQENPTLCSYVRHLQIYLFDTEGHPADAKRMEETLPQALKMLERVSTVLICPGTWNVSRQLSVSIRHILSLATLEDISFQGSLSFPLLYIHYLRHIKKVDFSYICVDVIAGTPSGSGATPLIPPVPPKLPSGTDSKMESLVLNCCGCFILKALLQLTDMWDLSNLKEVEVGFGEGSKNLFPEAVGYAWEFLQRIQSNLEQLTFTFYTDETIYTDYNLSVFPKLKDLNFTFMYEDVQADPLKDIIYILSTARDNQIETIEIGICLTTLLHSKLMWLNNATWKELDALFASNKYKNSLREVVIEINYGQKFIDGKRVGEFATFEEDTFGAPIREKLPQLTSSGKLDLFFEEDWD
ncbi:hypothetical protein BDQ17DRAFT_1362823 [Cyathus striatus]|nr:hypothetical protein BDQ17DRAFT_1362823 [Cyathus striatus]